MSKQHDHTILEVDLQALKNNVKFFKQKLDPTTKIMGMVKASSYGIGAYEVSKVLGEIGIDYLGVASSREAIELRTKKIETPILVMNMEEASYRSIVEHNIEPSISSFYQFEKFLNYLNEANIKSYPIHLKIDTGMNRLGFLESEIDKLIQLILKSSAIAIKGIFSHLAVADDETEDYFTLNQIDLFEQISNQIENEIGCTTIKSVLNSAGSERFSGHQFDMIRLGIGMFGISTVFNLESVCELKTTISQLKLVKKGASIGYGRSIIVDKDTLTGTISIGYADGFSRSFSNGKGSVLINGKYAPVIGKVSMDMTTIDLSEVDNVKEGDIVEIFGKNKPIKELAQQIDTIPYEILTSISSRVVREYK